MIYKTLHRKPKIKQHEQHYKPGLNAGAPEEWAVAAPHVAPVVLLVLKTMVYNSSFLSSEINYKAKAKVEIHPSHFLHISTFFSIQQYCNIKYMPLL